MKTSQLEVTASQGQEVINTCRGASGRTEAGRQDLCALCWHGDRGKKVFSINPAISFGDML